VLGSSDSHLSVLQFIPILKDSINCSYRFNHYPNREESYLDRRAAGKLQLDEVVGKGIDTSMRRILADYSVKINVLGFVKRW